MSPAGVCSVIGYPALSGQSKEHHVDIFNHTHTYAMNWKGLAVSMRKVGRRSRRQELTF